MFKSTNDDLNINSTSSPSVINETPTHYQRAVVGKLWIHAVEARHLIDKDMNGLSDPYIIFKVGRHSIRTSTIQKNLNPVWNEQFTVDIHEGDQTLEVDMFDEDTFSFNDDFMGKVSVSLSSLSDGIDDKWYTLRQRLRKEKVTGEVHLKLRLVYNADSSVDKSSLSTFEIINDVNSAKVLLSFMKNEYSEENLMFFQDVECFKSLVLTDLEEAKKSALHIIHKYIKLDADYVLNLSARTRKSVISKQSTDNWWENVGLFRSATREVLWIIKTDIYPRFIRSSYYDKLIQSNHWVELYKDIETQAQRTDALTKLISTLNEEDIATVCQILQKRGVLSNTPRGQTTPRGSTPKGSTTPREEMAKSEEGEKLISMAKRRAIITNTYVPNNLPTLSTAPALNPNELERTLMSPSSLMGNMPPKASKSKSKSGK